MLTFGSSQVFLMNSEFDWSSCDDCGPFGVDSSARVPVEGVFHSSRVLLGVASSMMLWSRERMPVSLFRLGYNKEACD